MIQAIIFDLDGLMVDTEPLSRRAWEHVLAGLGCRLDETAYASVIGLRLEESARRLKEACQVAIPAEEFGRLKRQASTDIVAQGVPTMPGLETLLAAVEGRGLPWGVATSSWTEHAQAVLAQTGLLSRCRALATGDEVAAGKPSPDVYQLTAKRLGVAPQRCLALEDSLTGAAAAVAAGMRTILVPAVMPATEPAWAMVPIGVRVYPSLTEVAADLPDLLAET